MPQTETDARELANRIATDLFTEYHGELADRLVLTSKDGKDLGGWCYSAVVNRIVACIAEERNRAAD